MPISLTEAVNKMTASAGATPETLERVLRLITDVNKDLAHLLDTTRGCGPRLGELKDKVGAAHLIFPTQVND